jgi:predicted amidophosphoribosyltransferase
MAGHGMFDFLTFQQDGSLKSLPLLIGLIVLFGGMIAFFVFLVRRSQNNSPYKEKNAELLILCPNCHRRIAYYAWFCAFCGAKLAQDKTAFPVFCGKCGNELTNGSNFCISCGSRMVKKTGFANEQHR